MRTKPIEIEIPSNTREYKYYSAVPGIYVHHGYLRFAHTHAWNWLSGGPGAGRFAYVRRCVYVR